jgi:hypothetical protein
MSGKRQASRLLAPALALVWIPLAAGAAEREFPQQRPATRDQAIELIRGSEQDGRLCLTPEVQAVRNGRIGEKPTLARALGLLRRSTPAGETMIERADGLRMRYTEAQGSLDRIDPTDADADGRPDVLMATLSGIDAARQLLVDRFELPAPERVDLLLVELGEGLDGYTVPSHARLAGSTIVLDATPTAGGTGARRAAIHQYAHAVALSLDPRFAPEWSEAFATWALLSIDGAPDDATCSQLDRRLAEMANGLSTPNLGLAAGNALWLAFVEEAYGPAAVTMTTVELSRGYPVATALDRGIRRVSTDDLDSAFREFQLWSLLVGARSTGQHFSFADRLTAPDFASAAVGLPALSVRADPPLAPLGATQVQLTPERDEGGLRVHFEGEFGADWRVDLLLLGQDGAMRRHAVPLSEGRGESTVPLDGLESVLLLIRNLGEDGEAHRYTYAAHHEKGYPFEIAALEARNVVVPSPGVEIGWSTASEQDLIGFNILRSREEGGATVAVNPIWIPALGDGSATTAYRFLDRTAETGVSYVYRIEGVTGAGLTSLSEPVSIVRPTAER